MSLGKKLLLVVVLVLPVAAYAGFRLMVSRNVEASLQQVAAALAPYAALRYGEVTTGHGGTVRVSKVEIQPRGMNVALPVESIEIETPGVMYLLTRAGSGLWSDARPETLRIEARDLVLDLGSEAGGLIDQLAALTAQPGAAGLPHCGNHSQVGLQAWRDMGINRLRIDGTIDYSADTTKDTARLAIAATSKDLAAIRAEAALSQVQAHSRSSPWLRGYLSEVRVVYKDEGYLDVLRRFCASASAIELPDFNEAEAGEAGSIFLRQWGITPGPALRTAYREFLAKPDTLQLDFAMPPDFKVENTGLYNASDLADSLSFTVSLNGKRADEQQYGFRPPREGPSQAVLAARAVLAEMDKPRVPPRKGESPGIVDAPKFVFHDVPKEQLHRYIGKQVRFHVTGSSVREGLLTGIDGGLAHVQRQRGDSEMTLTIALRHVERVEVQR